MANEASNGSIVRVGVGTSEAQDSVPRVGGTNIFCAKSGDLDLSSGSSILSSLVGATDVGQLIGDAVGNDIWVESLLLSLVNERVDSLEGEFGSCAAIKSSLKLHGWDTESEVETSDSRGDESGEVSSNGVGDCSESNTWGCAEKE